MPERIDLVPAATVARLPLYHRVLVDLHGRGRPTVSSEELARRAGVNAAKVRKDLSQLGTYGTRGVGYDVDLLLVEMTRRLGLTALWPVGVVGMGNLGRALANHPGFAERGFPVVAAFDADPALVGGSIGDGAAALRIEPMAALPERVASLGITIGVIATPAGPAQSVAEGLVAAGVLSILNFAPAVLSVPTQISVRQVDLTMELQILSFYQLHHQSPERTSREQARWGELGLAP